MPAELPAEPTHDADVTEQPATFAGLGVPAPLVEALAEDGITAPFPVQAATLPDALAGRDILGRARTGSGKTLGFSLPMVSRLAGGTTHRAKPRGLVLVPTRELATQVTEVLKPLAQAMRLRVTTIYGGVSYGPQVNALQRRTDIVVATPGRLADLIGQGECDLSEVDVTVIDEADQMADLGFLPIVRRLLETTPDDGQRLLFSATLDAAVDVLARRFLHDPVLHSVDENSSPAEIEHHVFTVDATSRVAVITALAGGEKRSLVFTRTKHGAERLARQLTQAGIPAAELHGNLRQGARTRNLDAFASGLARVMVATDIAARGIHIDGIDLVIHADPPAEHKAYVHRSGRTARGGADGVVVTLQTKAQVKDVTDMMRKAAITPHAAVAADAESAELTEISGPPAARVSVSGKVAELVQSDERLARNDRPGVGKPWEGRARRERAGDRERKPLDDRFRQRGPRDGGGAEADAPGRAASRARAERTPVAPVAGRPERGARARADDGERSARGQRPARFERGDHPEGKRRAERDDRELGGNTARRQDRGTWTESGNSRDRYDRAGRDDRAGWDNRPRRDDRGGRDSDRRGTDNRDSGRRGTDNRASDHRAADHRAADHRGTVGRTTEGRAGRDERGGSERGGNDWWPRTGGRSAPAGYRRPGASPRPGGTSGRDGGGNRGERGGWGPDDRTRRDNRPFRDDRGGLDDRGERDDRGRSQSGGQPSGPRGSRAGRPQGSGNSGGTFGGSSRRSGYSQGRGVAGKRPDQGRQRHF